MIDAHLYHDCQEKEKEKSIMTSKFSIVTRPALNFLAKSRAFGKWIASVVFFITGVAVMGLAVVGELFWAWGWLGLLIFVVGFALFDEQYEGVGSREL